jgi:hypothetical protein
MVGFAIKEHLTTWCPESLIPPISCHNSAILEGKEVL